MYLCITIYICIHTYINVYIYLDFHIYLCSGRLIWQGELSLLCFQLATLERVNSGDWLRNITCHMDMSFEWLNRSGVSEYGAKK